MAFLIVAMRQFHIGMAEQLGAVDVCLRNEAEVVLDQDLIGCAMRVGLDRTGPPQMVRKLC